jgi:thiamine biosynthesis lipoprotein
MKKYCFLSLIIVVIIISSCVPKKKELQLVKFSGEAQGTYYAVTYFDTEGRNFQPSIDSILTAFDQCASIYQKNSIISKINNNVPDVKVDSNFIQIFNLAQKISKETDGAFDCTVGPLVKAWGFSIKENKELEVPKIDTLMQYIGFQKVKIENGLFVKESPEIMIDFNAIAQGYSTDLIAAFLKSKGIENYLVDVGGEVIGKGKKLDGSTWIVGIEKPAENAESERIVQTRVMLKDKALCTSGNYRKYRMINGRKYSHEIDPKTGNPVTHNLLSVSVMASNCGAADAYATAFMVMGLEKSKIFLANHPELAVYFIYAGDKGEIKTDQTANFKEYVKD